MDLDRGLRTGAVVVDLSASFATLVGPWEMGDGDNEETSDNY